MTTDRTTEPHLSLQDIHPGLVLINENTKTSIGLGTSLHGDLVLIVDEPGVTGNGAQAWAKLDKLLALALVHGILERLGGDPTRGRAWEADSLDVAAHCIHEARERINREREAKANRLRLAFFGPTTPHQPWDQLNNKHKARWLRMLDESERAHETEEADNNEEAGK